MKTQHKITLSDSAARRINIVFQEKNTKGYLRVQIDGGGCSGFQYSFSFTEEKQKDDLLIENNRAYVLIDPLSAELMEGSNIDYIEELIGSRFEINNPNATANCGCGTSFSL